ncbi:hypothetical protein BH23GEM9_BH23GEM9_03620 [soil metagenome]
MQAADSGVDAAGWRGTVPAAPCKIARGRAKATPAYTSKAAAPGTEHEQVPRGAAWLEVSADVQRGTRSSADGQQEVVGRRTRRAPESCSGVLGRGEACSGRAVALARIGGRVVPG